MQIWHFIQSRSAAQCGKWLALSLVGIASCRLFIELLFADLDAYQFEYDSAAEEVASRAQWFAELDLVTQWLYYAAHFASWALACTALLCIGALLWHGWLRMKRPAVATPK